ncbi:MAG: aminoacyl-tRNA hydrolase [Lachnospiraceae bacterium]|nr:aminoacyl-tRNA hydrolase [Lachnospiraceae bacterium]
MYIIAGLGNPTAKYAGTRHNVGFEVTQLLAERFEIATDYIKHKAVCGMGLIEGNKVLLAMPQTFMNLSGESIRELVSYYKIDISTELIVICDDVNLPTGKIRVRRSGSAGGHNGLKNIIANLSTDEFMRVRIGVGDKAAGQDLADHVLAPFSDKEQVIMDIAFSDAADCVKMIITDGVDAAMNIYNRSKAEKDESV